MAGPVLTRRQLNRATLARQLLTSRTSVDVAAAVQALGGLQAQEARPPFVALWSRLAGFDRSQLHDALHARQVVRATGIRATLHLVTAGDYVATRPALEAMLADGLRALGPRLAGLDTAAVVAAAQRHLGDGPLTFDELRPRLVADFPGVNDRALGYTARLLVPLVMVPTADPWTFPGTAAFTLAPEWLGPQWLDSAGLGSEGLGRPAGGDGAVGELVRRYLAAFGPASVADFQAWSGLKGARATFNQLDLERFTDERRRELFDLPDAPRPAEDLPVPVRLLPEFDSVLLAHDDRTRVIADAHRPRVATKNLRINAVFLVDGEAAGLWSVERKRSAAATLAIEPFGALAKADRAAVAAEAEQALRFIHPDATTYQVSFAA
jgi:hypothetical protein